MNRSEQEVASAMDVVASFNVLRNVEPGMRAQLSRLARIVVKQCPEPDAWTATPDNEIGIAIASRREVDHLVVCTSSDVVGEEHQAVADRFRAALPPQARSSIDLRVDRLALKERSQHAPLARFGLVFRSSLRHDSVKAERIAMNQLLGRLCACASGAGPGGRDNALFVELAYAQREVSVDDRAARNFGDERLETMLREYNARHRRRHWKELRFLKVDFI